MGRIDDSFTAAELDTADPFVPTGVLMVERDTHKAKWGTGTQYSTQPYWNPAGNDDATFDDLTVSDDLTVGGDAVVTGAVEIDGALNHDGTTVGFFGVTPATRPTAYTQTYATADKTHAAPTAAALTVTDGAGTNDGTIDAITDNASTITAVQELADQINKLVADVADVKQLVNSVIDDLQILGIVT